MMVYTDHGVIFLGLGYRHTAGVLFLSSCELTIGASISEHYLVWFERTGVSLVVFQMTSSFHGSIGAVTRNVEMEPH